VSLNEAVRRAEREERQARALEVENRRRSALGLDPVASLEDADDEPGEDEDEETGDDAVEDPAGDSDDVLASEELASEDVLLSEAGNILVDALVLQEQAYALTAPEQEN
jgi:carboxyl-terminal processing protease